jgi:hypothetical protein
MSQKFYSISGEREKIHPKYKESFKKSIRGIKPIYIPELRITVYPKKKETPEQTRKRYLSKSMSFKNKI